MLDNQRFQPPTRSTLFLGRSGIAESWRGGEAKSFLESEFQPELANLPCLARIGILAGAAKSHHCETRRGMADVSISCMGNDLLSVAV